VTNKLLEERVVVVTKCAQHDEQTKTALASDTSTGGDVLARLGFDVELDPLTAVRVDGSGDNGLGVATRLEDDARRTNELRDDDTLGAVDDERASVRHHREVTHEDGLFLDFTRGGVHEATAHENRRGIRHVLFFALLHRELGRRTKVRVVGVELELQAQLAGEVFDGTDVLEGFAETVLQEPLERVALDGNEIGEGQDLFQIGKGEPLPRGTFRCGGTRRQRSTPQK
jgi:hypothetical protein